MTDFKIGDKVCTNKDNPVVGVITEIYPFTKDIPIYTIKAVFGTKYGMFKQEFIRISESKYQAAMNYVKKYERLAKTYVELHNE